MVSIRQDKLLEGRTLSCGYNKDLQQTRSKHNTNKFVLDGKYGIGYTYKGEKFYFDLEDYEKIIAVSQAWSFNDSGYLGARDMRDGALRYKNGRRKFVYLKDIIMNKEDGQTVVFIDKKKKYDCRKNNLIKSE